MLDSRWPRGPVIVLLLLIPGLFIFGPGLKQAIRAAMTKTAHADSTPSEFTAQRQGPYVYKELKLFAGSYWARVAGTDTDLPAQDNGHDEFAAQWIAQMRLNLHGLHPAVFRQYFPVPGFSGHRATRPGDNIIVFVRGAKHPGRAVVVGSHYDGEPASRGSAYDDTSGSMITLGLARSLGAYWRTHGLPSQTVEFVLFDAEEQGVLGSGAYLYYFRHAAILPHPTMMIDEEQSGVQYPIRPFGRAGASPLPAWSITTSQGGDVSRLFGPVTKPSKRRLALMDERLWYARDYAFRTLNAVYPTLSMHDTAVAAFTKDDESYVKIGAPNVCCSDDGPFEALGLPTVTFSGDFRFYDRRAPTWAFPYDQPQDTPTALVCDTAGSATNTRPLEAALELPLVESYYIVNEYAPPSRTDAHAFAVLSARVVAGKRSEFSAAGPGPIQWNFGDGGTATGSTVFHRYGRAGFFTVRVTSPTTSGSGPVKVEQTATEPHYWSNVPSPPAIQRWHPTALKSVKGCP